MSERAGQELSAEARQLIANARGADDPTVEDEARVKARWLAGIAAGAGVSSLSEAVRAAASTGWSWGIKAAVLGGAAAVAAVGVYLGWPEAEPPRAEDPSTETNQGRRAGAAEPKMAPARDVSEPSRAEAPQAPALEAAPTEAPTVEAAPSEGVAAPAAPDARQALAEAPEPAATGAPEPAAAGAPEPAAATPPGAARRVGHSQGKAPVPRAAVARQAARAKPVAAPSKPPSAVQAVDSPAPAPSSGQLGEEIAHISEVRGQLQAGSPARALELLAQYRARFAEPNLAMEADALQVDALCKAGKREAAREAAAAFVGRWPASPLQQRVSSACP